MKQFNSTEEITILIYVQDIKGAEDKDYKTEQHEEHQTIQFSQKPVMDDSSLHKSDPDPCPTLHCMSEDIGCSKTELIPLLNHYAR